MSEPYLDEERLAHGLLEKPYCTTSLKNTLLSLRPSRVWSNPCLSRRFLSQAEMNWQKASSWNLKEARVKMAEEISELCVEKSWQRVVNNQGICWLSQARNIGKFKKENIW
jgi:hypothetical protein